MANFPNAINYDLPGATNREPAMSALADAVSPYVGRKIAKQTFGVGNGLIAPSGPTQVLVNAGSTYIPALAMDPTTAEYVLASGVAIPPDCDGIAVVASFVASGDQTSNPAVYRAVLSAPTDSALVSDGQKSGACVVAQLPGANAIRYQTLEACFPKPASTGPAFLRATREAADGFDLWSGDANIATLDAIPVYLPEKPVTAVPADAYNSWPFVISTGSRLHLYHSKGTDHDTPSAYGRSVCATYSDDDGANWSAERTLVAGSPGFDFAACGKGKDPDGNVLLWVRRTAVANTPEMLLFRSPDGIDFTQIAAPTFPVRPIQITDIITLPTGDLVAFYMAGPASGEASKSYGIVRSINNGLTWTQTQSQVSADDLAWPTEISGAYVGNGNIMAIGRSEVTGTTTAEQSLFLLRYNNYGATFVGRDRTNISDVHKSTPSVIFDASGYNVYYFRRTWGSLRRRLLTDLTSVLTGGANARKWPAAQPIAQSTNMTDQDAGNANACIHKGKHYVAYYEGTPTNCAIMVAKVAP